MQVWKPFPKLPAPWREKYMLKYIMEEITSLGREKGASSKKP
jgi:hypothetical protein